jgi:hypothetical protein
MKIANTKPLIIFNLFYICYLSLQNFAGVDFSGGQNIGLGLLFGVLSLIFIPVAIFVLITYLRKLPNFTQWGKNDYYVLMLTFVSFILFIFVGNSRL